MSSRYKGLQISTSSSGIMDHPHHQELHPSSFKNLISSSYDMSSCPWFLKSVIKCSFHDSKHLVTNEDRMGHLAHHAMSSIFMTPLSLVASMHKLSCHLHLYSTLITPLSPCRSFVINGCHQ